MKRRLDKSSSSAEGSQSWRDLAGPRKRKINSPQARKRRQGRMIRFVVVVLLLFGCAALVSWAVIQLKDRETEIRIKAPSEPVDEILFRTNGVLPDVWLSSVAEIKPGMTLMEADIFALKDRLESYGQVSTATVERVFPSGLKVIVTERVPVMRFASVDRSGQRQVRIVSRDGSVYEGVGYPTAMLENLPFLDPHRRIDGTIFPLVGLERVAELMDLVSQNDPNLYRTWKVVSLTHYSGDLDLPGQVIEIRSTVVPKIIFSATRDYGRQLDRLHYILNYVNERGSPSIERIDLSLHGAAAVQFSSGRIRSF